MKIKIVADVPIGPEHGVTIDRVYDDVTDLLAEAVGKRERGSPYVSFMGDAGEIVKLFPHEYEEIE